MVITWCLHSVKMLTENKHLLKIV